MNVQLSAIPGAFQLPRPNWEVIGDWIERRVPPADQPQAWSEITRQWLDILREALLQPYHVAEADELLLLVPEEFEQPDSLVNLAAAGLAFVREMLGDSADAHWRGPLPILVFADANTYYQYVSAFFSEGEFGGSAGICVTRDHLHIALYGTRLDRVEMTVIHELVHACLAHLCLPQWLEEGVTQLAEQRLHSWQRPGLEAEEASAMRQYWREQGLQEFWWGSGFLLPDDGQRYSYLLSQVLLHLLLADYRTAFLPFFHQARTEDAGEAAAREHLGHSLGELAARFLGPGDWTPVPPDLPTRLRRGIYYLESGLTEQAAADFNEALSQDAGCAVAFVNRGLAHYLLREYSDAITDYTEALRLDRTDYHGHNGLAWLLATCPEVQFRDGAQAIEYATVACERSEYEVWYCLGTLAAAYAEAGDFEEARHWAKESLRRAPAKEQAGCKERLRLYREEKPYREEPRLLRRRENRAEAKRSVFASGRR
jgi:tetratricopeptide (TPR) repeat protein